MKLFFRYLKSKRGTLAFFFLTAVLLAVSFLLYRLPAEAVLYPFLICFLLGCVFLGVGFLRTKKTHAELGRVRDGGAEVPLRLPPAGTLTEEDLGQLIASLQEQIAGIRAEDQDRFREMVDYYTVWAHQIKTPIASMKLRLQNEDSELSRQLSVDLFRTQQYVEMVLAFLRLGADSTDYVFREYELDGVIRASVRKFAPEFIGRKLSLDYEPVGVRVVTDEKWLSFVLEQLLSNALKYTREGGIRIGMKSPDTLCIADTGIGIAPEDLPRIFEKGYTGYNGRTDKSASGLGLYLCRRVCDNLGIVISVASRPDAGTEVFLRFSGKTDQKE